MRWFIIQRPWLYWLVAVLTLGNFHSYQKGWEDGIFVDEYRRDWP